MAKLIALVARGGALGACARFALTTLWIDPGQFPWPTLVVNVAGSFGIGLLWGFGAGAPWFESWGRYFLVVGVLGGFTTFSAFSLESVGLLFGLPLRLTLLGSFLSGGFLGSLLGCPAGLDLFGFRGLARHALLKLPLLPLAALVVFAWCDGHR